MREKTTSPKNQVTFLKELIKEKNRLTEKLNKKIYKHKKSTKTNNDNNNKCSINTNIVETKSSDKNYKNNNNKDSIMITR